MVKNSIKKTHIRYNTAPDFSKPLFKISPEARERMLGRLSLLYGGADAEKWMPELERILKVHYAHKPQELMEAEKDYDPKAVYRKGHDPHHLWRSRARRRAIAPCHITQVC